MNNYQNYKAPNKNFLSIEMRSILLRTLMLGLFLVAIGRVNLLYAQSNDTSVDELFQLARQAAFEDGNYEKARDFANRALEISPDYHEIRIFFGRTYAWQGRYEEARNSFEYVLNRESGNRQALLAMIYVESWSGRYESALKWCQQALNHHPTDREFLYRKGSLLETIGRYDEAKSVYNHLLELHPGYSKARKTLRNMKLRRMKYKASVSYRRDQFTDIFDPWNFTELQINRQTEIGSIIGRIQYANRFSKGGVQVNIDAYPTIVSGLYAYLNVGYSRSTIFPRYRLGGSLYKSLPAAFEVEGGIRYLDFLSSDVTIYTASISKYYGSYLFTGRTYYVPSGEGDSQSFNLLIRRYLGGALKYIGLSGGYGSASEEIRFEEDLSRLESWFINAEAQFPLNSRINIGGNAGYDSEEFRNFQRNRFSFKIYLTYRF